jgi:hypothetical protein
MKVAFGIFNSEAVPWRRRDGPRQLRQLTDGMRPRWRWRLGLRLRAVHESQLVAEPSEEDVPHDNKGNATRSFDRVEVRLIHAVGRCPVQVSRRFKRFDHGLLLKSTMARIVSATPSGTIEVRKKK